LHIIASSISKNPRKIKQIRKADKRKEEMIEDREEASTRRFAKKE